MKGEIINTFPNLNGRSLGVDKSLHLTLYLRYANLSMLSLKPFHVNKRGPGGHCCGCYLGTLSLFSTTANRLAVTQTTYHYMGIFRADSRLAPSQWETSLQSNAVSHWLGANLESALYICSGYWYFCIVFFDALYRSSFQYKTAERHILLIQYILFKYYVPWRLLFSSIYTEKVHCCVGTSLHGTMMGLLLTDSKHVPEVISLRYPFWKKKKIIQFRMLTILYCGRVTELMPNHRGCPVPFTI